MDVDQLIYSSLYIRGMKMLGETLKTLRIFYGYRSVEMANKLEISQSFLSEVENNKKNPTIDLLNKYSKVLKIKVSTIILLSESMKDEKKDLKHNIAGLGMRILKVLKENGELEDD